MKADSCFYSSSLILKQEDIVMEHLNNFPCHTYGEGRTGNGQFVNFTCRPEEVEQVKEFLKKIRTIDIPTTSRVAVSHGGYGQDTRYDIKQHDYAGGGCGYIEVLEINNPPEGRCGIVINEYNCGESVFTEWETLKNARDAFTKNWGSCDTANEFPKLEGFKRSVVCNALTPWFYAIGDEELVGDYAFPDGLQDDPVYRFGKKFVVFDCDGVLEIKTCMGARFLMEDGSDGFGRQKKYHSRLVYWDDGEVWREEPVGSCGNPPRLLEEGEIWIVEAVKRFRELLLGKTDRFTVNFVNGSKFVGNLLKEDSNTPCAEGDYDLIVKIKGEEKPMDGWVTFKPDSKNTNIIQYVKNRLEVDGKKVESINIVGSKTKKGGKKWAGVYYSRQT